jgi:hypothetical protein
MSQHDYIIDNALAPAFRSDLNAALAAAVTQNSGATAPPTTYANMLWYDTTNDLLKIRNEANSAFITVGTVDQTNNVFNPNFLPATQAEAEAGTNNVKGVTPLRVAQAIAALSIPTTAQVGTATAGLAAGAVGSYIWAVPNDTATYTLGSTIAGSLLLPTGAWHVDGAPSTQRLGGTGAAQAGTWRCMGTRSLVTGTINQLATLWLRIS